MTEQRPMPIDPKNIEWDTPHPTDIAWDDEPGVPYGPERADRGFLAPEVTVTAQRPNIPDQSPEAVALRAKVYASRVASGDIPEPLPIAQSPGTASYDPRDIGRRVSTLTGIGPESILGQQPIVSGVKNYLTKTLPESYQMATSGKLGEMAQVPLHLITGAAQMGLGAVMSGTPSGVGFIQGTQTIENALPASQREAFGAVMSPAQYFSKRYNLPIPDDVNALADIVWNGLLIKGIHQTVASAIRGKIARNEPLTAGQKNVIETSGIAKDIAPKLEQVTKPETIAPIQTPTDVAQAGTITGAAPEDIAKLKSTPEPVVPPIQTAEEAPVNEAPPSALNGKIAAGEITPEAAKAAFIETGSANEALIKGYVEQGKLTQAQADEMMAKSKETRAKAAEKEITPPVESIPAGAPVSAENEHIVSAAARIGEKIFTGKTHGETLQKAIDAGEVVEKGGRYYDKEGNDLWGNPWNDLFQTDKGNLMDRFEASKRFNVSATENMPSPSSSKPSAEMGVQLSERDFTESKKHNYLGIRTLGKNEKYAVGDKLRNSYDGSDESSGEMLKGTSTTQVDNNQVWSRDDLTKRINEAIANHHYGDGDLVLVGGKKGAIGQDSGERVIENGTVISLLKRRGEAKPSLPEGAGRLNKSGEGSTLPSVTPQKGSAKKPTETKTPQAEGRILTDTSGKPLTFYHGSDEKFDAFDKNKSRLGDGGFFFSQTSKYAKEYGDHLVRVNLSSNNPVDLRHLDTWDEKKPSQWESELAKVGIKLTFDREIAKEKYAHQLWHILDVEEEGTRFLNAVKDAGYDGIRIKENGTDVFITTDPKQIHHLSDLSRAPEGGAQTPLGQVVNPTEIPTNPPAPEAGKGERAFLNESQITKMNDEELRQLTAPQSTYTDRERGLARTEIAKRGKPSPLTPSKLQEAKKAAPSVVQPDKFYVFGREQHGDNMHFIEAQGAKPIKLKGAPDLDVFVANRNGEWTVSEGRTGSAIGTSYKTRKEAIEVAERNVEKHSDKLNDVLSSTLEKTGLSPRYVDVAGNEARGVINRFKEQTETPEALNAKIQERTKYLQDQLASAKADRAKMTQAKDATEADKSIEKMQRSLDAFVAEAKKESSPPTPVETGKGKTTEATAEDFELHPNKVKDFTHIAIKLDGKVYQSKYGENGVFNHADLVEKNGLMNRANEVTPGFINKKGEFVESGVTQKKSGTLQSILLPGVSQEKLEKAGEEFLSKDVIPKAHEALVGLGKAGDSIKKVFAPVTRGEGAQFTSQTMRVGLAEKARTEDIAYTALEKAHEHFAKMPKDYNLSVIDAFETGKKVGGTDQTAIDQMHSTLEGRWKELNKRGLLDQYIENYFPHLYKDPEKIGDALAKFASKRPLAGSKSFLKQRSFPTIREAQEWGKANDVPLELVSDNPVDVVMAQVRNIDKLIMADDVVKTLKPEGLMKFTKLGEKPPKGWVQIQDPIGRVMQYSEEAKSLVLRGNYYMPEPAATIINNYLSPGISNTIGFKQIRQIGNFMNQVQLGLSGFHAGFTTNEAAISNVALAVKEFSQGKFGQAGSTLIKSPIRPITNVIEANKFFKDYLRDNPEDNKMLRAWLDSGARKGLDKMYYNSSVQRFWDVFHSIPKEWNAGNPLGAGTRSLALAWRTPGAMIEYTAKPLMQWLVPRQKTGAFINGARDIISDFETGKIGAKERVQKLQLLHDSIDNRFGQLVYDNLFWNKTLKDILMLSTRSVGWNFGTLRELGGGLLDAAKYPRQLLRGKPEFTDRMAYTIALPSVVALEGAMAMYLMTGRGPQELKDYFFPKSGNKNPDGTDERLSLPSYMKDVVAYTVQPSKTVAHKLHPMWGAMYQMMNNENYYGAQISDADALSPQWMKDYAQYAGTQFVPFSITGMKKRLESGSTVGGAALPFVGVTPAPKYIDQTKAEKMMSKIMETRGHGIVTKDKADVRDFKNQFVNNLKQNKLTAEDVKKAVEVGAMTPDGSFSPDIELRLATTSSQRMFRVLTAEEAIKVFNVMGPQEQVKYFDLFQKKLDNAQKKAG